MIQDVLTLGPPEEFYYCPSPGDICCDSCHDDFDEYGYDLIHVDLPNGSEALVCCRVSGILDALKVMFR